MAFSATVFIMILFRRLCFMSGIAAAAAFVLTARGEGAETNRIWFSGQEIFPIDPQITQLHVADFDGDGLNDLVVVNNARSKITILYNQTGKTNATAVKRTGTHEVNELPPDSRFRIDSIASEKRIAALAV